ncbi:hypothetical protein Taro_024387, partial [Colocasia esculenta]|nr:hypothetical protein [Colocasia esculenta]
SPPGQCPVGDGVSKASGLLEPDIATNTTTSTATPRKAIPERRKTRDKGRKAVAAEEKGRARGVVAAPAAAPAMRLEGVDEGLSRMAATANLDHAPERRGLRDAFREVQLGIDHCLFRVTLPSLSLFSFALLNPSIWIM